MSLLDHAIAWHTAGYTPVAIAPNGQKRPAAPWKALQDTQPTLEHVRADFTRDTDGIGLICGGPTGLEMLEVEGRAISYASKIADLMADHGMADLWDRINRGYAERSPSGGIHWYYRVPTGARPNTKLARRPATPDELAINPGETVKVLIETRGQGGFTVIAPSSGRTHPTGKPWSAFFGGPATVPTLTGDERDALYAIISMLDEMPPDDPPPPAGHHATSDGDRPGDDYNNRATWDDILTTRGWTRSHHFGGNCYGWTRPGKNPTDGISATTGRNDGDNLFVFSTSTQFQTEKPYSKFAAYTLLEHGGDWSAAAKALHADGYGAQPAPLGEHGDLTDLIAPHRSTGTDGPSPAASIDARPLDATKVGEHYGATEDGTARALVHLHKDQIRYCPQSGKWLHWTGARWEWDQSEHHRELIRAIARNLPDEKGWASYKRRAMSAAGVTGIARLARTDAAITVHINRLDANPYELNTPGGIIDLRTGTARPADPAALHTRTTTVAPDFDQAGEHFTRFLADTFGGQEDLIGYVQRILGVAAIGVVLEQILPFGYGGGANGKTTLLDACSYTLGRGEEGYAISAPAEMLMVRKHTEHPAEIAQLVGARLVVCSELEETAKFAEARVKLLTGGDPINARFMRRDPFTFTPSHTFFMAGNSKPATGVGGAAFWRRLRLIPFAHVVPEADRDPRLAEKLEAEAGAILAWIARGAAAYLKGGIRTPQAITAATEAYASEQDTIGRFVDEECDLHPSAADTVHTSVTALRGAYETWCATQGDTPVSARRLTQELRDRFGVESIKASKGRRSYGGVSLRSDSDDSQGWFS